MAVLARDLPDGLAYHPGRQVLEVALQVAALAPDPDQLAELAAALPRLQVALAEQMGRNEHLSTDQLTGDVDQHTAEQPAGTAQDTSGGIRDTLAAMPSREKAVGYLAGLGLRKPDLLKLARSLDVAAYDRDSVDTIRRKIADAVPGARLDAETIRGGSWRGTSESEIPQGDTLATRLRDVYRDAVPDGTGLRPPPEPRDPMEARLLIAYYECIAERERRDPAWRELIHPAATRCLRLADLRNKLQDLPREHVDRALDRLVEHPQVVLLHKMPLRTLTDADRAAAVGIGGEDRHFVYIARQPL